MAEKVVMLNRPEVGDLVLGFNQVTGAEVFGLVVSIWTPIDRDDRTLKVRQIGSRGDLELRETDVYGRWKSEPRPQLALAPE